MKSENVPTGAIIMVLNHKPLIALAAFFPTPQIRFFTPSKNENDGPPKTQKIPRPQNVSNFELAKRCKNRACIEWNNQKSQAPERIGPKKLFLSLV